MKKLLVIIRREYLQRIRTKGFIITSLLGPLVMVGFTVGSGLVLTMKTGGPTKVAVVDLTGRMYEGVRESIQTSRSNEGEGKNQASPAAATPDREAQLRQA
ncbi:MAG TPA: hypothetical protein VF634_08110, partial [Pyrinomonadaceae bacterium]